MTPEFERRWFEFSEKCEARIPWMYLDIFGYVTTGIGNLIDPCGLARHLPWRHATGHFATDVEIAREWQRVKGLSAGQLAYKYLAPGALQLDAVDIDALVTKQLLAHEAHLRARFEEWDSWPLDARFAVHSVAWAGGVGLNGWPKFRAALRARDWQTAGRESQFRTARNRGLIPRNAAHLIMFENARIAESNPKALPPEKLWWPLQLRKEIVALDRSCRG